MKMNYFVFGTNDMARSTAFYDALFEPLGLHKDASAERMTYWLGDSFFFALAIPFDGKPATNGNGTMLGFDVGSAELVEWLYQKAIELGGADEGAPLQKGPFFSAYVRDLDKNKICVFSQQAG